MTNWRDRIIQFQNKAEEAFEQRKTVRTTLRYTLAFFLFMLSTLAAGVRYPFAKMALRSAEAKAKTDALHLVAEKNMEDILEKNQRVLLEFGADWCGPCVMMEPALRRFAENTPSLFVGKVDADQSPELIQRYHIRGIPQVLLFENGKEVKRHVGPLSFSELQVFAKAS